VEPAVTSILDLSMFKREIIVPANVRPDLSLEKKTWESKPLPMPLALESQEAMLYQGQDPLPVKLDSDKSPLQFLHSDSDKTNSPRKNKSKNSFRMKKEHRKSPITMLTKLSINNNCKSGEIIYKQPNKKVPIKPLLTKSN